MNQKNDLSLSLSGDAFSALRSDFDQVLRSTLAGMIDTDKDTAEVSMKVKITLTEDCSRLLRRWRPAYQGNHEAEVRAHGHGGHPAQREEDRHLLW